MDIFDPTGLPGYPAILDATILPISSSIPSHVGPSETRNMWCCVVLPDFLSTIIFLAMICFVILSSCLNVSYTVISSPCRMKGRKSSSIPRRSAAFSISKSSRADSARLISSGVTSYTYFHHPYGESIASLFLHGERMNFGF